MTAAPSAVDLVAGYPKHFCPVCRKLVPKEFLPGPGGRPDAKCPRCGSLERHRFFAILLNVLEPLLQDIDVLLDVAPTNQTTPVLGRLNPRQHVRLDLGADNRLVDVLASLTKLPHRDDSVDLLVCYHVLEHIPDDRAAMREIARVLAPQGIGLLQVPFRPEALTDEDPDAPVQERLRRFGQADHVRYYGRDFEDRLVECGLAIQRLTPRSILGTALSTWLHLKPDEVVWLVRPADSPVVPPMEDPAPTALTSTFDALVRQMSRHRQELEQARLRLRAVRAERDALRERVEGRIDRRLARASRGVVRRVRGMGTGKAG